ncbi:MAG TPA: hypothetical protein VK934_04340 [Fimbriimonas sp.]|nr:hypothetical protein [Fimbriimonas sp.]
MLALFQGRFPNLVGLLTTVAVAAHIVFAIASANTDLWSRTSAMEVPVIVLPLEENPYAKG